ncbi:MAG: hypothetical protein ACO1SV_11675 [Fimbriimonas sp.]
MTSTPSQVPKKNAPWYVKAFVVVHLVCITAWSLPHPPEGIAKGTSTPVGSDWLLVWNEKYLKSFQPLFAYLFVTGTWQYWDMFSPNPSRTDIWVDAEVIYRDGTRKPYQYPRIYLLPIPSKYANERFRKFYERVNEDKYSYLWPQFAQRIAYLNDDPKNPPVTIRLTRHWLDISPPGKPQPTEYNSKMYFEYAVDQAKLAEMRQSL